MRSVAVIGLGYVGLPLALSFAESGLNVSGIDIDPEKIRKLRRGESYIERFGGETLRRLVREGRFQATTDYAVIAGADAVCLCLPTPLDRHRAPDLSFVLNTAEAFLPHLRPGQLISLESTTYPGTTADVLRPLLEKSGLKVGSDLFLGFSPEREDPGNKSFSIKTTPKIIGADDDRSLARMKALYERIIPEIVVVSSSKTAEAVKLTENIFRSVNVALVNELKVVFDRMGIDVWEVIEAAKTKPFGYMPFYPGPGLGGHCIPIDPFYLTWKAREFGISTKFIELAGEINNYMPDYVVEKLSRALDLHAGKGLNGAKILIVGIAYKKNVGDTRESPALAIYDKVANRGADVAYHDPLVPSVPGLRRYPDITGQGSIALTKEVLEGIDAAIICTDHDGVDYELIRRHCPLIVDTRNVFPGSTRSGNIVPA
ncbi:MAG: nucleotide sugar dehydrogenase [Alphaproteobacteria bacterium]|nr:nucleotide sugar dehydrogenase [Alphaproteobacteria bacterium]